jgi:putative aldouronate transport system permease protein
MQVFNSRTGLYGVISESLSGQYPTDLLGKLNTFRHMYVWSTVWQNFGWQSIIYIAALAGVDTQLHEAAQIDGASRLQRIWHVDLPYIEPTIMILLIMGIGNIMSVGFEKAYLMQNSLNLKHSELISTYVYRIGLSGTGKTDFSYATAIGLFNALINLVLILGANAISRRVSETSLW